MKKLIVIGAGLSGLYAAYLLRNRYEVTVIEARDRLGGRILTKDEHDLGPSWIWPHHKRVQTLVRSLNLELFAQYSKGDALYERPDSIERFVPPPSSPAARIKGGINRIIDKLAEELQDVTILTGEPVINIRYRNESVTVSTAVSVYDADQVIIAVPPRIALTIDFTPSLDQKIISTLQSTPTWMGHSRKVVIEYPKTFWREHDLSGFVFSLRGPLSEIHDASTCNKAALFGFVGTTWNDDKIEQEIIEQLIRIFGAEAGHYTSIFDYNWRQDKLASMPEDWSLKDHPSYGYELNTYENRLHFISTESSFEEGGYLEGALNAATECAKTL